MEGESAASNVVNIQHGYQPPHRCDHRVAPFKLNTLLPPQIMKIDDISDEIIIESCMKELEENPEPPIQRVAEECDVDRSKLRRRL